MADKIRINLTALGITLPAGTDFTVELDQGTFIATNPTDAATPIQLKDFASNFPTLHNLASSMSASASISAEGVRVSEFTTGNTSTFSFTTDAAEYVYTRAIKSTSTATASASLNTMNFNRGIKSTVLGSTSASLNTINFNRAIKSTVLGSATLAHIQTAYTNIVKYTFNRGSGFNGLTFFPFKQYLQSNTFPTDVYPIVISWGDGQGSTVQNHAALLQGKAYSTSAQNLTVQFTFNKTPPVLSGHDWSNEPNSTTLLSAGYDIRPTHFFKLASKAGNFGNNLTIPTTGFLPTSVDNLSSAFRYSFDTSGFFNQNLNALNVSRVVNFSNCFEGQAAYNQPLGSWNTIKATNMQNMFYGCQAFDQPLNNWNVSNVVDMSNMFANAFNFGPNQDFTNWDTGNLSIAHELFLGIKKAPLGLSGWDTSSLTHARNMFAGCKDLSGVDFASWDMSNVNTIENMFSGAGADVALTGTLGCASWHVETIRNCRQMWKNTNGITNAMMDSLIIAWNTYLLGETNTNETVDAFQFFPAGYNPSGAAQTAIIGLQNRNWNFGSRNYYGVDFP